MKKLLAILIATAMIASLAAAAAMAYEAPGDDGNVSVAFMDTDMILPDGTISDGEWPEGIAIGADSLVTWFAGAYTDTITFYSAWNANGFYIAADIPDSISTFVQSGLGTRFQIALNPGALIDSNYPGLFFSFVPYAETDDVHVYRHNWRSNADEAYDASDEDGYVGKYTVTDDGWCFECIIPWAMIANAERTTAVNSANMPLTEFDPYDESGAFCTAMICYIPCDGTNVLATGRTCMNGNVNDWNVSSYDVTFWFEPIISEPDTEESEESSEEGSEPEEPDENGPVQVKDINGDGYTDNKDVVSLFRYVSGSAKEADETKYDVDGDGFVNNKDVVALFRALSRMEEAPSEAAPETDNNEAEWDVKG